MKCVKCKKPIKESEHRVVISTLNRETKKMGTVPPQPPLMDTPLKMDFIGMDPICSTTRPIM